MQIWKSALSLDILKDHHKPETFHAPAPKAFPFVRHEAALWH